MVVKSDMSHRIIRKGGWLVADQSSKVPADLITA
jgi:hypothetical protein